MNANARLTAEENRVAELAAWGLSQKEIADTLNKSVNTVMNQFRSIYAKIGINKINELSAWWFCVNFNISFDLSPIKRKAGAVVLLLLFSSQLLDFNNKIVRRIRRGREIETICRRGRGREEARTISITSVIVS